MRHLNQVLLESILLWRELIRGLALERASCGAVNSGDMIGSGPTMACDSKDFCLSDALQSGFGGGEKTRAGTDWNGLHIPDSAESRWLSDIYL